MELVIARHGETNGLFLGSTRAAPRYLSPPNGRRQAASLHRILNGVLRGELRSCTRARATSVGDNEAGTGRTRAPSSTPALRVRLRELRRTHPDRVADIRPGWNIWRDGCPDGESVEDVGTRAERFLEAYVEHSNNQSSWSPTDTSPGSRRKRAGTFS